MKGSANSMVFLGMGLIAGAAIGGWVGWDKGLAEGTAEAGKMASVTAQGGSESSGGAPLPGAAGASEKGGAVAADANAKKDETAAPAMTPKERLLSMLGRKWDMESANGMLDGLGEAELAEIIAQTIARKGEKYAGNLKNAAYRAWARKHPEAALAHAKKEKGSAQEKLTALSTVLGEWALTDGLGAVKQAEALDVPNHRVNALQRVVLNWAGKDQKAVLDYLAAHPDMPGMGQLMYSAFQGARSSAGTDKVDFRQQMALMEQYAPGATMQNVMSSTMMDWAGKEPDAALAYALNVKNPALQAEAIEGVYQAWALSDLNGALKSAEGLADSRAKEKALSGLYGQWLQLDPLAATDAIVKNGSPALLEVLENRSYLYSNMLTEQESKDLLGRLPEGEAKTQIVSNMVSRMTSDGNYGTAVDMAKTLTDAGQRENSLFNIATQWTTTEPAEMEAWMKEIPASAERDAVVGGYIATLAETNLTGAISWMESMAPGGRKQGAMMNIGYWWMRSAPADAEVWMKTQGMTESDIQSVKNSAAAKGRTMFTQGGSSYMTRY